jgi:Tat protein secretion system quality control protein TatD with DNase activity
MTVVNVKQTEYLKYTKKTKEGRKTYIIDVRSTAGDYLGVISWFSHWRRYVFHPVTGTIYDAVCLIDISQYINDLMRERKN